MLEGAQASGPGSVWGSALAVVRSAPGEEQSSGGSRYGHKRSRAGKCSCPVLGAQKGARRAWREAAEQRAVERYKAVLYNTEREGRKSRYGQRGARQRVRPYMFCLTVRYQVLHQ